MSASLDREDVAAAWHAKVQGRWFGCPSHYDAHGTYVGYTEPKRTIVRGPDDIARAGLDDGGDPNRVLIDVPGEQHLEGPLKARLEIAVQSAWVRQTETARVYEGPDFYGAGYPYGSTTLGWVYFCPWKCDAKVIVQILPDHVTQVYDNVQYVGETMIGALNGRYMLASDHDENVDTQARVRAFLDDERRGGKRLHRTPLRQKGTYRGALAAFDRTQTQIGDVTVTLGYEPLDHHRVAYDLDVTGPVHLGARYVRARHESEFYYEGPDVFGNGKAAGRSLYLRTQLRGDGRRWVGREFLLDDDGNLAVVYELMRGHQIEHVLHGVLTWHAA